MSMRRNSIVLAAAALLLVAAAVAQESLTVDLPPDSPVALVAADWGSSGVTPRGGAVMVELHTALRLRNASQGTIRAITLLVEAQEVTPGGKASVSVPSLNARPGESFPVRIDLRLLRPIQQAGGPLVRVSLDGVLFDDLRFYGPDRLNSRRTMTVWETEARRDREYFRRVLAERGRDGLRDEALASLDRQASQSRVGVQVARRTTVASADREIRFAFVRFPGAPIEALAGMARMSDRGARDPRLEVRNRSDRAIRYLEISWLVRDSRGREFVAGAVPAEIRLAPGAQVEIASDTALRFSEPVDADGMRGFLSQVEYDDGEVWIPSRAELSGERLDAVVAPSPEEQRLTNLYRKQGIDALIAELDKF